MPRMASACADSMNHMPHPLPTPSETDCRDARRPCLPVYRMGLTCGVLPDDAPGPGTGSRRGPMPVSAVHSEPRCPWYGSASEEGVLISCGHRGVRRGVRRSWDLGLVGTSWRKERSFHEALRPTTRGVWWTPAFTVCLLPGACRRGRSAHSAWHPAQRQGLRGRHRASVRSSLTSQLAYRQGGRSRHSAHGTGPGGSSGLRGRYRAPARSLLAIQLCVFPGWKEPSFRAWHRARRQGASWCSPRIREAIAGHSAFQSTRAEGALLLLPHPKGRDASPIRASACQWLQPLCAPGARRGDKNKSRVERAAML